MLTNKRKKCYIVLIALSTIGHVRLWWHMAGDALGWSGYFSPCIFKYLTSIPCPSCNTTTASVRLWSGDVSGSLYINPMGILIAMGLVVVSILLVRDAIEKKYKVYAIYQQSEKWLRKPSIYISLTIFILTNWLWTITKTIT